MMIFLSSIPLNDRAVAQVLGGASLPDGLQELAVSLELKCSQTGEWFSLNGGPLKLSGNADSDEFEDILRAKLAEMVDIDQEFLSERGARIAQRGKLIEQSSTKLAAFHALLEAQGDSELASIAKEIFALDSEVIGLLTDELDARS